MKESNVFKPTLYESDQPVTVQIGSSASPSPSTPLHINISDSANLIPPDEIKIHKVPKADHKKESEQYLVPLEEIVELYSAPFEEENNWASEEDSCPLPETSMSDHSSKRKKKKNRKEKAEKLLNNPDILDEPQKDVQLPIPQSLSPNSMRRPKALPEYALFALLKAKYTFGCFGTTLFVRGSNGVYSEVTKDVVASLLYETLTEEQKMGLNIMRSTAVRE